MKSAMTFVIVAVILTGVSCGPNSALSPKKRLDVRYSGRVVQALIFDHEFRVHVWHQNPGTINAGIVRVKVSGEHLKGDSEEVWSFDQWPPNKENEHTFVFHLDQVGDDVELDVSVSVKAHHAHDFGTRSHWKGNGWVSRREATEQSTNSPTEESRDE